MEPLDNPFWASLATVHRGFAVELDGVALVTDPVYLVGPRPLVPPGWLLEDLGPITQMVCTAPLPEPTDLPIALLTADDRPAVLALAALVYPHYFRSRTTDLGTYRGLHGPDRLDAMIGERMALPGLREISAVCTHPSCTGRGLARALLAIASNAIFARDETPFLHVSPANTRAVHLYQQNHYRRRRDLAFYSLRRLER
jgi:GNAT superfamily N-acetyltransferase